MGGVPRGGEDVTGGGAAGGVHAPKFHLRFESGRGAIALGRSVQMPFGVVERLSMELSLDGAVQLNGGASRFRHHRSRLTDLRVVLRPRAFERVAAERGVPLAIEGPHGEELLICFRDAVGACAWRCRLITWGSDVLIVPVKASFVRRGAVAPWVRLVRWVRALGGVWSAERGAFRWPRPVRALLAEALLPHGWRVPDERGRALRFVPGELALEVVESESEGVLREEVEARAAALEARTHPWCDPVALAPGAAGAFERALDAGKLEEARRAADAIEASWVRADALEAMAERFEDDLGEDALADLLLDALAERPNDPAAWRRWIGTFAEQGSSAALRLARAVLGGPLPRATRAALAARAVDDVFSRAEPEVLDRVDTAAAALVEEVEELAPQLAEVLAARAALHHRHGELAAAARAWERAAEEAEWPLQSAVWRRRAGELLLGLRGPAAAEPLLRQALLDLEAAGQPAPTLVAQLAAVLAERGDSRGSRELFGKLLREPRPEDEAWRVAALAAARFHVENGDDDLARPFLAALGDDAASVIRGRAELDLAFGETFSWPGGEPSSASFALGAIEGDDDDLPRAPTQIAPVESDLDGPPVTFVSVADDELRALLRDARGTSDPAGILDGALERALEDGDPSSVRRVLRVLDRLDPFPGERILRERAKRLLETLGEPSDE